MAFLILRSYERAS